MSTSEKARRNANVTGRYSAPVHQSFEPITDPNVKLPF